MIESIRVIHSGIASAICKKNPVFLVNFLGTALNPIELELHVVVVDGIKVLELLDSDGDENMMLQLNRIERRSQEIGKNNRVLLASHRCNAAVTYPDGQEQEHAIDALVATCFLAVQASLRKLALRESMSQPMR